MKKTDRPVPRHTTLLAAALLALGLAGCGGGSSDPVPVTPPPATAPALTATAAAAQVLAGGSAVPLSATVSDSTAVAWQLAAGSPGTLSGTAGAKVDYLPPASVTAPTLVTVTASAGTTSTTLRLAVFPDPGAPRLGLLAGSTGSRAILDGTGTDARFAAIASLAIDSQGNAVVADRDGAGEPSYIRKVTAAGVVTTLSRLPRGHADGDAAHGQIGDVISLAPLPDGSIRLLDRDDALRVRTLRPDGSIVTMLDASRVDQDGLLLLADGSTTYLVTPTHVLRLDGAGPVVVAGGAGSVGDGKGAAAGFAALTDGVISDGVLYAIDRFAVRAVDLASGQVTTLAGAAGKDTTGAVVDGAASAARFNLPGAIALEQGGALLVADRVVGGNYGSGESELLLRRVTRTGAVTTVLRQDDSVYPGIDVLPATGTWHRRLRALPDGALLLSSNAEIRRGTAAGFTAFAGLEGDTRADVDGPAATARFVQPTWIAADLAGTVYVTDRPVVNMDVMSRNEAGLHIRKIAPDGMVSTLLRSDGDTADGIAVAANGDVFVGSHVPGTSRYPNRGGSILKISPTGTKTVFAGVQEVNQDGSTRDGTGSGARFGRPQLEGIDAEGNLYVSDNNLGTAVVRKVTPSAVVTTIAALPAGLKAAPDGNVYRVDPARSVVTKTTPAGVTTVVAGVTGIPGPRLGALPGLLNYPVDIAPTGPGTFAITSGGAVLKLVLPH